MAEHSLGNEASELNALVSLNFKITERERRAFKMWCASQGFTQVEAFKRGFKLLKEKE